MAKIPWGLFDAEEVLKNDDTPWTKLKTIAEHLEDGDAIPFHLSVWLGRAIQQCNEDPENLMKLLGLKKRKGAQKKFSEKDAMLFGKTLFDLENEGLPEKAAIESILIDTQNAQGEETLSRSNLQRWRNEYSRTFDLIAAQNEAERIIEFLSAIIPKLVETYKIDINEVISAVAKNHDSKYDEIMKDAEYPEITKENLEKWVKSYKNHSKNSAHKS